MAKNEDEKDGNSMSGYAKYSAIGFQMIAIIGLFTYAGIRIDAAEQHTTKWVTAIMSLAGVFISLYIVIRSVRA